MLAALEKKSPVHVSLQLDYSWIKMRLQIEAIVSSGRVEHEQIQFRSSLQASRLLRTKQASVHTLLFISF